MTDILYPAGLPAPAAMTVASRERRAMQADRPQVGAMLQQQTDDVALVQSSFVLSEAQAEAWRTWYEDTLVYGGCWFRATWPLPQGRVPANFHMVGHPTFDLLDGVGAWRVAVVFEVRVRAVVPQATPPVTDTFEIGWFSPPTGSDPNSASTSESGTAGPLGSPSEAYLNCGLVPYVEDGEAVVSWYLISWIADDGFEIPPPDLVDVGNGYGTIQVRPHYVDNADPHLFYGVATFGCFVGEVECPGSLVLTIAADGVLGYGEITWSHS